MEVQELFYWVASVVLTLIGLLVITAFAVLFYIKRLVDKTAQKVMWRMEEMSNTVSTASKAWRNLTLTRFVLRALRFIF
jgi:hypothetical protein